MNNKQLTIKRIMSSRMSSPIILTAIASSAVAATLLATGLKVKANSKTAGQVAQIAIPVTVQISSESSQFLEEKVITETGSGVIIRQEEMAEGEETKTYTVLTANHVVDSEELDYQIRTHTGQVYEVASVQSLQESEKEADLALVTFQSQDEYPTASLGDSQQVSRSAEMAVFGYSSEAKPFVYSPAKLDKVDGDRRDGYEWSYKAATKKGMNGGPVFDESGQLVAINGKKKSGSADQSLNRGIPIDTFTALSLSEPTELAITPDNYPVNRYAGASHFYCDTTKDVPTTMARNVVTDVSQELIRWVKDPEFDWGIEPQERCKIVSGKFQRAYYENKLDYLNVDNINNYPVICGLADDTESCTNENILITFQPETNASQWLKKFLQGQTGTVRGNSTNMRRLLHRLQDE